LDRLMQNSEAADAEVAEQQRRAVRRMFDLADGTACLWRRLAGYFAETIPVCRESCGNCLERDILIEARPAQSPARSPNRSKARTPFGNGLPAGYGPAERELPSEATPDRAQPAAPDEELFERLRALRKRLADERQVPAYVVFSDRTLQAMTARRPGTQRELLEVHGVGQRKLEEYGELFLAEILRQG
jgi:ATP-dependent DNA helicase RecQ